MMPNFKKTIDRRHASSATLARAARGRSAGLESLEGRQMFAWGPVDATINLAAARSQFPAITGQGQTIAVIDSGTNFNAPVLQGKFLINTADPIDGKDNDGDGYVDDNYGWNFVNGNNNPTDVQGHGTMVSGTLAASHYTNTGNPYQAGSADYKEYEGVASGAKLLALKIAGGDLSFNVNNLEKALQYVVANRVRFNITAINLSLGLTSAQYAVVSDELATLNNAGVFIASPSGFGPTMSVGITSPTGAVISGGGAQIVAPGSLVPVLDMSNLARYWIGGTAMSYASPFVTGAGALIKQVNPRFTAAQVQAILTDSAQSVSGYKRLDVAAAIKLAYQRSGATVPSPITVTPVPPTPVTPPPVTPVTTARSPFHGTPITATNWIESEDFDNGGEGVSYHDTTTANSGGKYRTTGVDLVSTNDAGGGYAVDWAYAGEWLEYTVNVPATGTYTLETRLANLGTGASFHVNVDGANATGSIATTNTGGWNNWTSQYTTGVALTAGTHVLRVAFDTNGTSGYAGIFNGMRFALGGAAAAAPVASAPVVTTPVVTAPAAGTRSAYAAINGSAFNSQSGLSTGGGVIGSVDAGDYAGYTAIDFGTAGATRFDVSVAVPAAYAGRQIVVRLGGPTGTIVGRVAVQATGSWGAMVTQSATITKVTGVQNVYLTFEGGAGVGNIASFKFA